MMSNKAGIAVYIRSRITDLSLRCQHATPVHNHRRSYPGAVALWITGFGRNQNEIGVNTTKGRQGAC